MSSSGAEHIARSLQALGVEHVFGIVGIPVIEVAEACRNVGIRFISFRNEQSASYAASIYHYLTLKPGVLLVVGGPGVIHALAGVENAIANRFALLVLAGSSERHLVGLGAFQELDQVCVMKNAGAKFSEQPATLHELGDVLSRGYNSCQVGKCGVSYVDLPADLIKGTINQPKIPLLANNYKPRMQTDPNLINSAVMKIKEARFPLLIVGKGCAWSKKFIRNLQLQTKIGFVPTPMGKGVIPDSSFENLSAARSLALSLADVVIVLGARLNWILHFGKPPRFNKDVCFIQCTDVAEDVACLPNNIGLVGDVGMVAQQLAEQLTGFNARIPNHVLLKRQQNIDKSHIKEQYSGGMLRYEVVYAKIRSLLKDIDNVLYVSEGANTMDKSRTSFMLNEPRRRLDAGTNATMGVGMGYAIAAKLANKDQVVVAIEGDSAFGFSAMEIETAVRNKLPIIIFVMNNSGVYHGSDPKLYNSNNSNLPSTALSLKTKYHDLAISLGANGYLVNTLEELEKATHDALNCNNVALINVIIDPEKDKKLEFAWMSKI